jgi:hypothetical protein
MSLDVGLAELCRQIGVLAVGLEQAWPQRLTTTVQHGVEIPRYAHGPSLQRRDSRHILHNLCVERARHGQRLRKERRLADIVRSVNRVQTVQQRNFRLAIFPIK